MRSTKRLCRPCVVGIAVALLGASSAYGESGAIELRTSVQKRIQRILESGKIETVFEPAATIVPGDTVVYTIEAQNVSAERPAERVVITDPIPEHTRYVEGSAEGEGAQVFSSVDGGMRFAAPDALEVVGDDGGTRAATANDYTHIRWVFRDSLAPSETRAVRFFARLQ